eukprot:g31032.t1
MSLVATLGGILDPGQQCTELADAIAQGRVIGLPSSLSDSFLLDEPAGMYYACILDNAADAVKNAPLNSVGTFEVSEVITSIVQSAASTRTTLRLDVAAKLPGVLTCVIKDPEVTSTKAQEILAAAAAAVEGFTGAGAAQSETKMVVPSDPNGLQFNLPGQAPLAHTLPTFLWPGAAFVVFMENVVDTSQSRVKMVNNTIECDASTYSEAIPVVLNTSGQEQPIKAYLTASSFKRMFCFFELPASLPIAVSGDQGTDLQFASELQPSLSLIVDDAYIQHMSRGLASNLVLYDTAPGELAQAFILDETDFNQNGGFCLPALGLEALNFEPETAASYIQRVAAVQLKTVSVLPTPVNLATHFVSVTEDETLGLSIGHNYVLCYVGSADTTRVFNKIGSVITVKDIILALEKEQRPQGEEAATSREINVVVQDERTIFRRTTMRFARDFYTQNLRNLAKRMPNSGWNTNGRWCRLP